MDRCAVESPRRAPMARNATNRTGSPPEGLGGRVWRHQRYAAGREVCPHSHERRAHVVLGGHVLSIASKPWPIRTARLSPSSTCAHVELGVQLISRIRSQARQTL
jgi:hypothetical protein